MSHHEHHHPPAAPLDLLDECWFFSNTLNNGANKKKPPLLPKSPSTSSSSTTNIEPSSGSTGQGFGCHRRLLRTPSLPSPRIIPAQPSRPYSSNKEHEEEEQAEVDDDDLNWSSIYEGILRSRITAASSSSSSHKGLQRAPSMPVVPSSTDSGRSKEEMITPSSRNKLRHSYSTLERHTSIKQQQTPRSSGRSKQKQQQQPAMMMARSKSALFHAEAADKKKWKSSSDLESIEVQGFKDLGFVFDQAELKEDLADVLPGLNKNASSGHAAVRRPYLSEAWHNDRRPPALIRVQSSEARSAAEMKDQLRMWAQAVACNARQECV